MLTIVSANLNGIRAASKKGFFEWINKHKTDIVCIQETKAQLSDMNTDMTHPGNYQGYFDLAMKKGYSGVGLYTKVKPDHFQNGFGSTEFDPEGRYIQCDFDNLSVVSLYSPSGSSSEERQQAKFRFMDEFVLHLQELKKSGREFIICGDWNIAHKEMDLKNWKSNQKNSGFLPEERAWMTRVLEELGWVDVYRYLYPDATGEAYTWWSNRGQAYAKNVGWRIDYQIATPGIASKAISAHVYKAERFSDHAPLVIEYDWPQLKA